MDNCSAKGAGKRWLRRGIAASRFRNIAGLRGLRRHCPAGAAANAATLAPIATCVAEAGFRRGSIPPAAQRLHQLSLNPSSTSRTTPTRPSMTPAASACPSVADDLFGAVATTVSLPPGHNASGQRWSRPLPPPGQTATAVADSAIASRGRTAGQRRRQPFAGVPTSASGSSTWRPPHVCWLLLAPVMLAIFLVLLVGDAGKPLYLPASRRLSRPHVSGC